MFTISITPEYECYQQNSIIPMRKINAAANGLLLSPDSYLLTSDFCILPPLNYVYMVSAQYPELIVIQMSSMPLTNQPEGCSRYRYIGHFQEQLQLCEPGSGALRKGQNLCKVKGKWQISSARLRRLFRGYGPLIKTGRHI